MRYTKTSRRRLPFDRAIQRTLSRTFIQDHGTLGIEEQEHLRTLNRHLHEIEVLCLNEAQRIAKELQVRVLDPNDPFTDFEIEARVTAYLREDDPTWSDEEDNLLAMREYELKRGSSLFCDGVDWGVDMDPRIQDIGLVSYTFHDFHTHSYQSRHRLGREWRSLPLRDLLRIGSLWLDFQAIHQWKLKLGPCFHPHGPRWSP